EEGAPPKRNPQFIERRELAGRIRPAVLPDVLDTSVSGAHVCHYVDALGQEADDAHLFLSPGRDISPLPWPRRTMRRPDQRMRVLGHLDSSRIGLLHESSAKSESRFVLFPRR